MRLFGIRIAKASTIEREISTAVDEHKWKTLTEASKLFRADGYQEWVHVAPPRDGEFFLIRAGWYFPTLTSCIEVSPYMNTVGAFWKLAEGNHGIISGQNARVN